MFKSVECFKKEPWQWWVTLVLPRISCGNALLTEFTRAIGKMEKLRVGCLGVLVENDHVPHLHLFMVGISGKTGRTLAEVGPGKWEREWWKIAKRSAKIIPVGPSDIEDRAVYCFENRNLPNLVISQGAILKKFVHSGMPPPPHSTKGIRIRYDTDKINFLRGMVG